MQNLLYLTHRIPYPPNKGDKIRSYHLLKYLSERYHVYLGTFIDDPNDWQYVDQVKSYCEDAYFAKLSAIPSRIRGLGGLLTGEPLTIPIYRDKALQVWVNTQLENKAIDKIVVFSAAMAQYVRHVKTMRRLADFVDIDSDKWRQYAERKTWPLNWIYQRESEKLLNYEKQITSEFDRVTFVSEKEAELFKDCIPQAANKITYFNNGVDTEHYAPLYNLLNPYQEDKRILVFTGAMDYWANVDAVEWFTQNVFPKIRDHFPDVEFYIVGSKPSKEVIRLGETSGVTVTGFVEDVRPYLLYATLAVAPLRIARGIQNKVLEAMAMGKTVVASPEAKEGIVAEPGQELFVADGVQQFAEQIVSLLRKQDYAQYGQAARKRIVTDYSWASSLSRVDAAL